MSVILQAHRANESLDADLGNMNYYAHLKKDLEKSLAGAINLSFIQGFSPRPCLTSAPREELHRRQRLNTHRHKHFGPGTRMARTQTHVAHAIKGVDTNAFAVVLGHPPLHPQGGLLHRRRKIWRDVTAWHGQLQQRQRCWRRRLRASRAPPQKSERQT